MSIPIQLMGALLQEGVKPFFLLKSRSRLIEQGSVTVFKNLSLISEEGGY